MNKINFFEQNIETGLTKSHSRSGKNFPRDFLKNLKTYLKLYKKNQNCLEFKKNQKSLNFPEIFYNFKIP